MLIILHQILKRTRKMSKYTAEFTSINSVNYLIEIETEKGTKTGTFKLSGDPLNSTMDSDGKTLFSPIKCSGMSVSILTNNIPFDLYSGSALGTKINVKEGDRYIFKGFLTPCSYSMGFDSELEEIQLECVDGISVLKEIPYSSSHKDIRSFLTIIFNCLKKSGCFKNLYITNNIQFSASGNESVFDRIRISENNFFDKKDYELQPDSEIAMSCYDVLFEIMQYTGCTIIAEGEDVFILDYDAIRNSKNKYWRYDITGNKLTTPTQTDLTHSYKITDGSYAESGSKIDLSETFNKIKVTDDFYSLDSIVEGLNNSKNWINITSPTDEKLLQWVTSNDKYGESCVFTRKNGEGEDESFFVVLKKSYRGRIYFVLGKFFKNPMINTYHYNDSGNTLMDGGYFNNEMKYSKLWDGKGAFCVGLFTQDIESKDYNSWRSKYHSNLMSMSDEKRLSAFAELLRIADITNKKLTNYILCLNGDTNHIEHDKVRQYPYFTLTKNIPSVFGGENGYIIIQGSLIRHDETESPFPMNHKDDVSRKNTSIYKGESYFWARLRWGEKYWQEVESFGTMGGEWVDTPTDFKIFYGDPEKEQKANDFFDKNLPFYNTAAKIWGLNDENGFYVPAPTDQNLQGTIELTVYANKDTKGKKDVNNGKDKKNSYDTYKPKVVFFKGLDIKLCFADEALNEDAAKSDTVYTNEVSDYSNIREGEEIKCKICTFDNKTPSYSTTDYLDEEGKSQYIDKLFNQATNISLRPEEHIIYKIISQYQEPRVIFTANLKNSIGLKPYSLLTDKTLSGRSFIIDTIQRDYKYNKAEVSMIEKTNKYG